MIKIGEFYCKDFKITEKMIIDFSKVTGDKNPLHLKKNYAKKTIFKKRIAHGFLIGSLISNVLGNYFPGNGTIYLSQTLEFLNPVYINDYLKIKILVLEKKNKNKFVLKTECYKNKSILILTGEAVILLPS